MDPFSFSLLTGLIANACFKVMVDTSSLAFEDLKRNISQDIEKLNFSLPNINQLDTIVHKLEHLNISEDDSPKKIEKIILENMEMKSLIEEFFEKIKYNQKGGSINKTVNIENLGSGSITFGNINQ